MAKGNGISKQELSEKFAVSEKTIQRDIDDIRAYLSNSDESMTQVIYDHKTRRYHAKGDVRCSKEVALVISKILLESRAFRKDELKELIGAVAENLEEVDRYKIEKLIGNELFNYISISHNSPLLSKIWDISEHIREKRIINMDYVRMDGKEVNRSIKPVSVIFSEYYFYLIGYMGGHESPSVFRVDRILSYRQRQFYGLDEDPEFTWDDAHDIIVRVRGVQAGTFYNGRRQTYMDDKGRRYYEIWKQRDDGSSNAEGTMQMYNVYEDGTVEDW